MTTRFPSKKEEIYGYQTYWRELGNHLSKLELYQKSLKFYDAAVLKNPTDQRALLYRAVARGRTGYYQGAVEDVNKALEVRPDDLVTLAEKAHIAYLGCEFEDGLVQNSRLLSVRRKPECFYIGKMNCSCAITTCLGEEAGKPLRDHFKIIRKLAWRRNREADKPYEPEPKLKKKNKKLKKPPKHLQSKPKQKPKRSSLDSSDEADVRSIRTRIQSYVPDTCIVPPYEGGLHFSPLQKYTSNVENYMASKYLDTMYHEKIFLKQMQNIPGLESPNSKGVKRIKELAKDCYANVSHKQEVLRARRPFYYIKYQEAHLSGTLKARLHEDLLLHQTHIKREAEKILAKLRVAAGNKNLSLMLELADKLKIFCDSKPKRLLPLKDDYLKEVFQKVRRGFYELNRLNTHLPQYDQDRRIYVAFGQAVSREPSRDSIVGQYEKILTDSKQYVKVYTRRLKDAEDIDEICFCHHELARFNMELKVFDQARANARKCINAGRDKGLLEWVVNGLMLLSRIHMREQNRNDATADVKEAIEVAEELGDQQLINYLKRCLAVISIFEFEEMTLEREIEKRKKHILDLMLSDKLKGEFAHIFGLMAAMPTNRRMSVMPGVRLDHGTKISGKAGVHSIAPGAKASEMSTPSKKSSKSTLATKNIDNNATTGVGFMELVQFHV